MLFGNRHSHKSHIHYFTTLKGVVGMLRDPEHTESVFDIEDGLRHIDATQKALEYTARDPAVAGIVRERFLTPTPVLEDLKDHAEGTLGHAYFHHLTSHGFDPDYFRKIDVKDDVDYLLMRIRQTHDIWHVMTGLDTSPIGELGVKAFELAQTRRPMAAVITTGGVMRYLLHDPDELSDVLTCIAHGYRLGAASGPFVAQKWELGWDRPVADWRRELGVDRAIEESPYLPAEWSTA